ncbi:alpha/beta hydrolase [Pseudomonas oryzihabitans]|uniref:alpha/beta fold hydrolase n=1 Tax=Pseudomonas oryzihabitans TaxID=47885 RepID=UPI0028961783|nr:alpha/beta hydrolase [Pseudomonas oryzihabitans]MDT3720101.1 alpha/beta hydrolase [Pseudomonas oryzihabitans]
MLTSIQAGVLDVAYQVQGPANGHPVLLLHGFPYDIHAYDEVAGELAAHGCRVYVPYLRGYGATHYRSADTPRSGQQAALAHDVLALLDALGLERATLAVYDWGGRAAGIVAALWPERVSGLVLGDGYPIQDIARAATQPAAPAAELRYWYQYYFHGERGRAGLTAQRREFCRLLWSLWSPTWRFSDATYALTAAAFDNPDFVATVIHSYRHRYGLAPDDPAYAETEARLAAQPPIRVSTTVLAGADDGVSTLQEEAAIARHFRGPFRYEVLPLCGHNLPQEAPAAFAAAVRERLP